ncbi:MAG: 3-oxoacyl-ACP synthase [Actinomycetota bacterium]
MKERVFIADLGMYVPEGFESAAEISAASGIPEQVLVEKFGLAGKHRARPDEHVSDMCISAARAVVERNGAESIDAVMYFGSHWKDRMVWQVAPAVMEALGIDGFAFEAINSSAGAPVALKIARDMLAADPDLRSILMVAAARESGIIDYANPRSRFASNFGDGAAAALLRRDDGAGELLGSSLVSDGSFAHHVHVPAGGTAHPASHETVDARMHYLDVIDGAEMKRRLDPITIKRFVEVAREAVERSGYDLGDLGWFLPIHMKRSIHDALCSELGVPFERSVYLDHHGHMSAVDPVLSLCTLRDEGRLSEGDLILLLAAGTGYTWAATVVRWGKA